MTKDGTLVPARKRTSQDTLWFLCAAELLHAADMSMTTVRAECAPRSSRYRTLVLNRPSNFSTPALFTRVLLNSTLSLANETRVLSPDTLSTSSAAISPRTGDNSSRDRNNRGRNESLDDLPSAIREIRCRFFSLNLPLIAQIFTRKQHEESGVVLLSFPPLPYA